MKKNCVYRPALCLLSLLLTVACGFIPRLPRGSIIDHLCTDVSSIPERYITAAKSDLRIAYGHTSHGSQLTDGMDGLDAFLGGHGLYTYNGTGADGALLLTEDMGGYGSPYGGEDLNHPDYGDFYEATRSYLASHAGINVVIWSWCGGVSHASEQVIDQYLDLMTALETEYPTVRFVCMTGHLDGSGLAGTLHQRNEQIRAYCRTNNKWLFDFADIESYGPDGQEYLSRFGTDGCCWDLSGNGVTNVDENDETLPVAGDANWARDWQAANPGEWYACGAAHTLPVNANRKAFAAWWLWARLAGWNP